MPNKKQRSEKRISKLDAPTVWPAKHEGKTLMQIFREEEQRKAKAKPKSTA